MKGEICILVSFKKEIKPFIDLLSDLKTEKVGKLLSYKGTVGESDVLIVRTGKGEGQEISSFLSRSSFAVSTGICGALVSDLHTGDIVVSTKVFFIKKLGRDSILNAAQKPKVRFLEIRYGGAVHQVLREVLKNEHFSICAGPTLTTGGVLKSRYEKEVVNRITHALSGEMEDFYRLSVARELGVPFLSVRAVFDELYDEILPPKELNHPLGKRKLTRATRSIAVTLKSIIARAGILDSLYEL